MQVSGIDTGGEESVQVSGREVDKVLHGVRVSDREVKKVLHHVQVSGREVKKVTVCAGVRQGGR